MQGANKERWKVLCEQAAVEQDPVKLHQLIKEINDLLEAKETRLKGAPAPDQSKSSGWLLHIQGRKESLALKDRRHGFQQDVTGFAFWDESSCSYSSRLSGYDRTIMHRVQEYGNLGQKCPNFPSGRETIKTRQAHVQNDQIGFELGCLLNRIPSWASFSADFDVLAGLQYGADTPSNSFMVVYD
jgi:hypothetical protein